MRNYNTRFKRLEKQLKPGPPAVILLKANEPIPPEAGPGTAIIRDNVPKSPIVLENVKNEKLPG